MTAPAPTIREPTPATLKKYGLSLDGWRALLDSQGGTCAICKKVPTTGRMVIDHEHVKGWKAKPPEERKQFVRGLCCWWCNATYLGRGINVEKARNVVAYLEAYGVRVYGPKPANDVTSSRPCNCCADGCHDLGCRCGPANDQGEGE